MKIDRDVERFCAFKDWPEEFIVQVTALNVAVDHDSLKAVVMDCALHLGNGGLRICGRQASKSGKTGWVDPDRLGDAVVRFTSNGGRRSCVELLGSRRGKRQHLHVNPCGIHLRNSLFAKIAELVKELCSPPAKS